MKMSTGEQLVWAAVFAAELHVHDPPSIVVYAPGAGQKWEEDQTVLAIEAASAAVDRLRQATKHIIEGYGEKSQTYLRFQEMISPGYGKDPDVVYKKRRSK